ncbi:MAG: hypothetical protein WCB96_04780 [Candidatus Aminicenantales bacterium]
MKKWGCVVGLAVLILWITATGSLKAQVSAPWLPDLTVEKISLVQGCLVAVVVKNLGPGNIPDSVWTVHTPQSAGVYLYRNGSNWGGESIWLFDSAKHLQSPGGTATFVSNLKVSGTESIKAVVDLWNVVKEVNEKNNSLEAKLTCQTSGDKCCVAGSYKGIHQDTASPTCPTPASEEFKFEIWQANCGTAVTGKLLTLKAGVWKETHSFKGTISALQKCCQLQGEVTELTTGKVSTINGTLCFNNGKWSVTNGTYQVPGGCAGKFTMQQI